VLQHNTKAFLADPSGPITPSVAPGDWVDFAAYLTRKQVITGDLLSISDSSAQVRKLRELWEITNLSAAEFADETAQFYQLPRVQLPQLIEATSLAGQFSHRFLREVSAFPCRFATAGSDTLVLADPTDLRTIQAAELVLGEQVDDAVASFEDITSALSDQTGDDRSRTPVDGVAAVEREDDIENLRDLASGAPVVRAVNDLLEKAIEQRATDIHIELYHTSIIVRMRIDGLLRTVPTPSDILPQALISRIKILSGLNIAERRLPQDGAAHLRIARADTDIRVATMPTQYGENAVIRLLPKDRGVLDIEKLGLSKTDQDKIKALLALPHGILIITGPTGSGKTTTLATMLSALNDSTRKILTIEDPIEYEIRGINQSQVKPDIGLTFAAALRSFLRQDPDVIMVGEIRDRETAHIAIHAALTGHLVLTTLHTETAAAAVPRLIDLGVERFLLQSTLRAVVAQRLVRILCNRCRTAKPLTATTMTSDPRYAMLGLRTGEIIFEPGGCERCSSTGYRGRTGVFEVLETADELRELIGSNADSGAITRAARQTGMTTMFEDGIAKCRAGVTSASDVLRVTTMR
jgi:general secretion pathway protein E